MYHIHDNILYLSTVSDLPFASNIYSAPGTHIHYSPPILCTLFAHLRPTSKQFTTGNACGNIALPTHPSYNQSRGRRKQDFSSCLRLVVVRKYSSKTQRDQGRQHKPSNQWRENGHLRNVIIFFDRDKSTKQHQRRQQTTPDCIGGTERSKCSAKRKVLVLWMP